MSVCVCTDTVYYSARLFCHRSPNIFLEFSPFLVLNKNFTVNFPSPLNEPGGFEL